MPSSTDVACIGTGKIVKVTVGANVAGVVQAKGALDVLGGSLEVDSTLEPSTIGVLKLEKATLKGAATVNVSESLAWDVEGIMSGSGKTVLEASAAASVLPLEAACEGVRLTERTFVNSGTFTFGGTVSTGGSFAMSEGARFENYGTFKDNSLASECSPSLYTVVEPSGTRVAPLFVNKGTFERTATEDPEFTTEVAVPFENQSKFAAVVGGLGFGSGVPVTLSSGSILEGTIGIAGANVTAGSVTATAASVSLTGGTVNVTSGSVMSLGKLYLTEAALTGAGTLYVAESLDWERGGVMSGSGKTVLESGSTGRVLPEAAWCEGAHLTERTLVNNGTLSFSGPTNTGSSFVMGEGAILENNGTFKDDSTAWECSPFLYTMVEPGSNRVPARIINFGTFERTETSDSEFVTVVAVPFENWGLVREVSGPLEFTNELGVELSTLFGEGETCGPEPASESVSCASGNYSQTQTDFSVPGRGVGLDLTRTYNSQAAAQGSHGVFGYGWTSSFSDHLTVEPSSHLASLVQAEGNTISFTEGTGGAFTAPAWTQDTLSGTAEAGYTLTLTDQTKYKFSGGSGRLESVTDRNGNATTLAYNGAGHLETITDPSGRKITFSYNAEGLVESAKDPMGHVVKYTYENGNLASVSQPGEASLRWQFKYDEAHQLTELIDGRGGKTLNEYNTSNQVVKQTDPMSRALAFVYRPFHTQTTNVATGAVTQEYLTNRGTPASITHGYGTASATTESFGYDTSNDLLSTTDGDGHTTRYTYDGHGNRTSMLDANGLETKWTYDSTHDVETATLPSGEKTTTKRDSHGNPETIERPAPGATTQVTKYKYDAHGDMESMTDPLSRVWKYEYDTAGDRIAEIDPESDKRTWGFNEDSQETSMVSPRGHVAGAMESKFTTKTERDAQGRPIKITDPLLHETKYKYDGDGNTETKTDPEGNLTTYTYDADNEQTKVTEPDHAVTETGYDGAGQVTSQKDGNGHTTTYNRNVLEQITEIVDPLSRKTLKEYDKAGNLTSVKDAAGRTTTYKYDPGNRLTEIIYSSGTPSTVKYEYNVNGDRTKMIDGTGTSTSEYDQLDRLTETKDGHGNVVKYEYDLANETKKITYPNTHSVTRAYDNAGRLKSTTDWLEHTTSFGFDADNDLTKTTFPTGTSNEDTYAYDETDAMKEVKIAKGAETLASLVYTRGKDGELKGATSTGLPGGGTLAYTYDANTRLTKGAGVEYAYDAANNPTTIGSEHTYAYNSADELEKSKLGTATLVTYTYDELGERTKTTPTTGPATTYAYNQANELTGVTRPHEGTTAAIEDTYAYNGDGLRTSQTISGTTTYLAWDTAEKLPLNLNDGTNTYIYGPGGFPVEQISTAGTATFLHHDQQGSTRVITSTTGAVVGTTTYDGFGNKTGSTGTTTTPLGYDGQYTDADTGLIYLRARYYDPATGQFISIDPKVEETRAVYGYAQNDPGQNGDPTGLSSESAGVEDAGDLIITANALRSYAANSVLLGAAIAAAPYKVSDYVAITPEEYATFLLRWAAYFDKVALSLVQRKAGDATDYLVRETGISVDNLFLPYRFKTAYCWYKGARRGGYGAFWCGGKEGLVYQKLG